MKSIFIKDIKIGDNISDEIFVLKSIKKSLTKDGNPYCDVELSDNSGNLRGKIWSENIDIYNEVKEGDVVRVFGKVSSFKDLPQITVSAMSTTPDFVLGDLVPVSDHDINEMIEQFNSFFAEIENKHLKQLLENIFTPEVKEKFYHSPAAYTIHHAYGSGLLEHVLDILEMAKTIAKRYPKLNKDLLFTGAILHDIGKLEEYSFDTSISMTTKGKLLGHVYIGSELVRLNAPKDMPEDLIDEVIHMVLAHQGSIEFGSPVLPKTAEAIAISTLDDASFKINTSYHVVHGNELDEIFTSFQRHLGTDFYISPYIDKE